MNKSIFLFALCLTCFSFAATANNIHNEDPKPVVRAAFDGGQFAFQKYIKENLQYPTSALEYGVEGQVTISFYVLTDGTIQGAKIVKSLNEQCDEVALKVISKMPKWVPAQRGGKFMATKNYLTLNFFLE